MRNDWPAERRRIVAAMEWIVFLQKLRTRPKALIGIVIAEIPMKLIGPRLGRDHHLD